MSKVNLLGDTSYAGFFTVNETFSSNMYFWFFPAQVSELYTVLILIIVI